MGRQSDSRGADVKCARQEFDKIHGYTGFRFMELSAEILHSAVASIKPMEGERRQHERMPFRFKIKIIPYENRICYAPISLWTRDISPAGIGLLYRKTMREGSQFIIRLPRQYDAPVLLLCTVRNCVKLAPELYGIGASFAEVAESRFESVAQLESPAVAFPTFYLNTVALGPELTKEAKRISDAILA
jgi:hypothetical protein